MKEGVGGGQIEVDFLRVHGKNTSDIRVHTSGIRMSY